MLHENWAAADETSEKYFGLDYQKLHSGVGHTRISRNGEVCAIKSVKQSPSWEHNRSLASKEILILQNLYVHYCTQNNLPPVPYPEPHQSSPCHPSTPLLEDPL